ncbi:MAG: glycosyltransferase family 2 protein [Anaerolineales bacterium]|jgi:glycosyltransferase involved in cell wall biosynthesis
MNEKNLNTDIELSIVMPCLNEELTIGTCIKKAQQFLEEYGVEGEIVVADNGSTDSSLEIAKGLGARIIHVEKRGYGNALRAGIHSSYGKYIIMGDSDDSYDFTSLSPFLEKLREGYELVMGNRFAGGILPGAMPWHHRYIGNPILSFIGRLFFKSPVKDFHCGLRGFTKAAFDRLDLHTGGMEFASELVIKASMLGLKISEVPTVLSPDGRDRPPHLRSWRDGWRHLRFMLIYSPTWLFFIPGIVLMIIGFVLGIWIFLFPVEIYGINLEINSMLYSSVIILLGFSSILFSVIAWTYGYQNQLLIQNKFIVRFHEFFRLEKGLLLGALLFAVGIFVGVDIYVAWGSTGFGELDPFIFTKRAIFSTLFILLGSNVTMGSFLLSIIRTNIGSADSP